MSKYSKKQQAFTLIELLIALFVFVITMTLAVTGLLQLTRNNKSYHDRQLELTELQNALILIQFDLMQTIKRYKLNAQNQIEPDFLGNKTEVIFNKIGYYNEKVHYYMKENDLYRNNQLILSDVSKLRFVFIDNTGKKYTLWPPTRDWAYVQPNGIQIVFDSKRFGQIEKWIEVFNGQ